jgi:hypothetical protein
MARSRRRTTSRADKSAQPNAVSLYHRGRMARGGHAWTPYRFTRTCHARPFFAMQALWPFQRWPPAGWAACGRLLPLWAHHAVGLCLPSLCSDSFPSTSDGEGDGCPQLASLQLFCRLTPDWKGGAAPQFASFFSLGNYSLFVVR